MIPTRRSGALAIAAALAVALVPISPRRLVAQEVPAVTHRQGDWAGRCRGDPASPPCLRDAEFPRAFPAGLRIGDPAVGHSLAFSSAEAVRRFLPKLGDAKTLARSADDPGPNASGTGGAFAGHVLAAELNVGFDAAGLLGPGGSAGLREMELTGPVAGALAGWSVRRLLDVANAALAGRWGHCGSSACLGRTLADVDGDGQGDVSLLDIHRAVKLVGEAFVGGRDAGVLVRPAPKTTPAAGPATPAPGGATGAGGPATGTEPTTAGGHAGEEPGRRGPATPAGEGPIVGPAGDDTTVDEAPRGRPEGGTAGSDDEAEAGDEPAGRRRVVDEGDDHPGRGRGVDKGDDHPGRGRGVDKGDDHPGRGRGVDKGDDHPGRGRGVDKGDDHPGRGRGAGKGDEHSGRGHGVDEDDDHTRRARGDEEDDERLGRGRGLGLDDREDDDGPERRREDDLPEGPAVTPAVVSAAQWGRRLRGEQDPRAEGFTRLFPRGLVLGDPGGRLVRLTSMEAVTGLLPLGGPPTTLSESVVDPDRRSAPGGALLGQLVAARLNLAFGEAGLLPVDDTSALGALRYRTGVAPAVLGRSVAEVITFADALLAGRFGECHDPSCHDRPLVDTDGDGRPDLSLKDVAEALARFNDGTAGVLVRPPSDEAERRRR